MIDYLLAVTTQISFAVGAIIFKKHLEKIPPLPLSSCFFGNSRFFSFVFLVLTIIEILSLPGLSSVKTDLKQIISSENLRWVIIYSFFFCFFRGNFTNNGLY